MKITHLALCGPVTDYLTYQDNLLPKYHKRMDYEVSMITSKYIWNQGKLALDNRSEYFNEYGIKTIRLDNKFNTDIQSKFKIYRNLFKTLVNEAPDILFIHGVQFLDIYHVIRYLKRNPKIKVFVDNHADFSNSATNWLSKKILHQIIWRFCAQKIEPFTEKFYGVLPARVDFLENNYKIPSKKIELLVMGADDDKVFTNQTTKIKNETRDYYDIKENDFLIVTGGKIDGAKQQVIDLIKAVIKINNPNLKLIIFGSLDDAIRKKVQSLLTHSSINFIGWIDNEESYKLFSAADLVVFPGRHSVYWEQVVAMGKPLVIKYWEKTDHIDIGGNCLFLYEDSFREIYEVLNKIIKNENVYKKLLQNANNNKKNEFLYSEIAQKSLREV